MSFIRTGLPILVELINLGKSVIIFKTSQMTILIWLTFLLRSQAVILIVLLFWFYFFLLMVLFVLQWFPPLGNSDHIVVSISIDFPSNSQRDAPFHCKAYDCSRADWGSLCDHLRDVLWEDIFKFCASVVASEFCECVKVEIDVYIPHRNYQVKPHSSPWFPAACAATIVHLITFSACTSRINLLNLK